MSLVAKSVGYCVDKTWLVKDINLEIAPGEMLVILGPNGAGKSTLFKMLSGEWPATTGEVILFDKPVAQWQSQGLAQRRAILPQHSSLTFPFRVEEVIRMGRTPHDTGAEKDEAIVSELLALCDLQALRKRLYPWLSGGEKQRVQLARVLAQIWPCESQKSQHNFLFLDEPTSALDIAHQHSMLKIAKSLTAQGYSVLVILHDLNLAAAYADRVLMMHNGTSVGLGSVREVFQRELLQQVFNVDVKVIDHPERNIPWVIW